jgi:Skp family chaperone for outer membrane proteins
MLQRMIIVAGLVCMLGMPHAVAEDADGGIAFLNVSKTFDSYNKTVNADKNLASKSSKKEEERQRMIGDLKKMRNGLDMLSDDAREKRQQELEDKARMLREFEQVTESQLRGERDKMAKSILKEIDQGLQTYAQEHGFGVVLNQRAIVYGAGANDITDAFIQWLNTKYKP